MKHSWWLVLGLLVLSPICAEYLSAYDDSTGHPAELIGNLVIFVPLYGCAALLIREVARRARLGWVGILLLAAAFGVVEAGLVDQSLFSPDYRGLAGWDAIYHATLITPLGLSVANLVGFVGGHVMLSVCGPIALVEAWQPASASRPWLRLPGLVITAIAYVIASVLVLQWHLQTEDWHASPGQLICAGVVVLALVGTACWLGRRPRVRRPVPGPGLGLTAAVSLLLATTYQLLPQNWPGVAGSLLLLGIGGFLLDRAARTQRWGVTHVAVVGAAPLLATAVLAFTYEPLIGEVTAQAKYGHNVVMLGIVLVALGIALLRNPTRSYLSSSAGSPVDSSVDSSDASSPSESSASSSSPSGPSSS